MAIVTTDSKDLLTISDLSMSFGGIVAISRVSLSVRQGQIYSIIGPNGAGKTTLFNCLSRLYTPDTGEISFKGHSILKLAPSKIEPLKEITKILVDEGRARGVGSGER